ncbi:MAG TPA: flagellar export chaperone FlgN [Anaeromyxobacteraceae bacterium]|nr:flagellar export chaperone FlgN [Anaeromyxobacteraceae bacterium]
MDLAVATAEALHDVLAREVENAREESRLLRRLDASRLFDAATRRTAFLSEAGRLEKDLAARLAPAGAALKLREVTLDGIRAAAPELGGRLADVLGEVRALAASLSELDRLNHALASRALACVRGYVEALAPTPRAYDRRGGRAFARGSGLATVSNKV